MTATLVLRGLGVSPGIAIGPAYVVEMGADHVPEYAIGADDLPGELERFGSALAKARHQLRKLKTKSAALPEAAAEEVGYLLDAHLAMVSSSRLTRGVERRIREDHINAEAAVHAEINAIAQTFAGLDDSYIASRVADVREVGRRLIRNLTARKYQAFSTVPEGAVILAEDLSPADTALMDPSRISGFACTLGGAEGHTAIMARSLGLPAVLGATGLLPEVANGDLVVIDGTEGTVVVRPDAALLDSYRRRQETMAQERAQLRRLRRLPAVTRDGTDVTLLANIELPREVEAARDVGAAGVGLLRSEFLYMNRDDLPSEEEQYTCFRDIVLAMQGRPVTIRTLDIGGEKLAAALSHHVGEPANPALGLRAIRLSLKETRLMETQLAAIVRAAAHGPVRILLPMVMSPGEVRRTREILANVMRRLKRRGVALPDEVPPVGAMIEVPAAALTADALATVCDFFAIGTNDLTQYTLAVDRSDEQVAGYFDPLHPGVLRLIQLAVDGALRARIPVSVCGEMAGEPRFAALLLGLGVRELSMAPTKLPLVKQRVRALDLPAASLRARTIMDQSDAGRIAAFLDDLNALA